MAKKKPGADITTKAATAKIVMQLPDKVAAISRRFRELKKQGDAINAEIRILRQNMADLKPAQMAADKLAAAGITPEELAALAAELQAEE